MRRLPLLLAAAIVACGTSAAAQERPTERPPRALVAQLYADLDEDHDFKIRGIEDLAAGIDAERRDLNGDGGAEWIVVGTDLCGKSCDRWIYRRMTGGRYAQLLETSASRLDVLSERAHGWPVLRAYAPGSAFDGYVTTFAFDGRRYHQREMRSVREAGATTTTAFRIVTRPDSRGRPGPVLEPVDAGGGLWISARHDACAPGRAACGPALLTLSSARLPAGRVCVRLRVVDMDDAEYRTPEADDALCGVTAPDPNARGRRRLVLRPRADDWSYLAYFARAELRASGLPTRLSDDAATALMAFAGRLAETQPLPCLPTHPCPAGRARARTTR